MRPRPMTYDEFARLPEGTPAQLIGGSLVCEPAPALRHQDAQSLLFAALIVFVRDHSMGRVYVAPVDVRLADDEVYQPDIIVISEEQFSLDAMMIDGAPMLVVEILSPSTGYYDLRHKRAVYARSLVPEYWVVDPLMRSIEVLVNRDGEFYEHSQGGPSEIVRSHILDGFSVSIDDIMPA